MSSAVCNIPSPGIGPVSPVLDGAPSEGLGSGAVCPVGSSVVWSVGDAGALLQEISNAAVSAKQISRDSPFFIFHLL